MQFLAHLFLPHQSNNYKAKILETRVLLAFSFLFLVFYLVKVPVRISQVLGYTAFSLPFAEIIKLTNLEREKLGLAPLRFDENLAQAATAKGKDMLTNDYWAHVSPSGITPWYFFANVDYKYLYAGENLARDFDSPEAVVRAWMASPTHRDNLLSARYEDIGLAVIEGELSGAPTTLVVQLFGKRLGGSIAAVPSESTGSNIASINSVSQLAAKTVASPFNIQKNMGLLVVVIFLLVLAFDWVIVFQKKLVRISGRTLAHFSFFLGIGLLLLIIRQGNIL